MNSTWDALNSLTSRLDIQFSRRQLMRRSLVVGGSLPVVSVLLAACAEAEDETDDDTDDDTPATETDDDADEPDVVDEDEDDANDSDLDDDDDMAAESDQYGGRLRVALIGEPPTLDMHTVTAAIVQLITWHIWEPLFSWDEDLQLAFDLADSYEASDDALIHTIGIREGVLFHNGQEMTSADVVASLERWSELDVTSILGDVTDEIVAIDEYTVEIRLNEPLGVLTTNLARQNAGCAIHPQEVMETAGTANITEYIGTGPFEFVEHVPDRRILVQRFDDYVARDEEPSGYVGAKTAYVDEIEFIPVPDEPSRIAGLRAGDYHLLETITAEQVDAMEDDPELVIEDLPPMQWNVFTVNWESPITGDVQIRRAIQAALDLEEIARAAWGDYYILQPGLYHEETAWHSLAGEEYYNRNDPETAMQLMEEAGYDGGIIRFMTTQEQPYQFNGASVAAQQLEDVGFEVELEVMDWATLVEQRNDPDRFEMLTGGQTFRIDPVMNTWITGCGWTGWWCDDEKEELAREFVSITDFDERYAILERLQEKFYEDVGAIKIADAIGRTATRVEVQGLQHFPQLRQFYWNLWLE
jgi:peptide/nickel transport system substrate-binding protein